jgi:hypothetical protein
VTATTEDPLNTQDGPSHDDDAGPPVDRTGYAELSREYAAAGRGTDAALAQWAADLHVVGPLLHGMGPLLAATQASTPADGPRGAVGAARTTASELVTGNASAVQALFSPLDHLEGRGATQRRRTRDQREVTVLLERAEELMAQARHLEHRDPNVARARARDADLSSFEALLLESARSHGDSALVSVDLRHDLARKALQKLDERTLGRTHPSIGQAVDEARAVLRSVVEPHELEPLESAFCQAPGA